MFGTILGALVNIVLDPILISGAKLGALIAAGAQMLRWQAVSTIFAGIVLLLTVLFQATGQIIPAFLLSISRQGDVFLAVLVVCVKLFAYHGVIMAQAMADVLSALLALTLLIICNPLKMDKEAADKELDNTL